MRGLLKSAWIAAFLGLVALYYALPQTQIGDSRYVIATADLLLRTGSLDHAAAGARRQGPPLTC